MLQTFVPYRTAIELCALDHGGVDTCDASTNGIPSPATTRYVSAMSVAKGVVALSGQESLNGLEVVMTPNWDNGNGITGWTRECNIASDSALQQACEDVFRFGQQERMMNSDQLHHVVLTLSRAAIKQRRRENQYCRGG